LQVGDIKKGINPSSVHQLIFSGHLVGTAAKIGLVAGLIAITEGIAIGRTFAALEDYHIDGNKEFIAFGIMNIAGSATSCYTTTGSFSRSAVNYNAGAYTTVSNIVMSLVVMVVLLALTPLFKYAPSTILAAVIIAAVTSLIDIRAAYLIWKVDKFDFLALLGAFFGVLFISVEIGLLIAVSKASTLPPNQCSLHHC
jgi:high affinity sulfate transporter 1